MSVIVRVWRDWSGSFDKISKNGKVSQAEGESSRSLGLGDRS